MKNIFYRATLKSRKMSASVEISKNLEKTVKKWVRDNYHFRGADEVVLTIVSFSGDKKLQTRSFVVPQSKYWGQTETGINYSVCDDGMVLFRDVLPSRFF